MTEMLGVPTLQFGNPVASIVLSKGDNPTLHSDIETIKASVGSHRKPSTRRSTPRSARSRQTSQLN